jgi:hypothetical protein
VFSASGKIVGTGDLATIQWTDGIVRGDRFACDLLRGVARDRDGQFVGPVEGPYTLRDHLKSGLSAVMLIRELFDEETLQWAGDVPAREPLPEGVIG